MENIEVTCTKLRNTFKSGKTKSYDWRMSQLRLIQKMVKENEPVILDALRQDLGRCPMESMAMDLMIVLTEIKEALKNLE
jgi:aldehyde dehydrogenase (NAD+)